MDNKARVERIASRMNELDGTTRSILEHWTRMAPDDRLAHLLRDAARGLQRSLQLRLSDHGISFGHWVYLRILWSTDGLSQRELSIQAGLMESTTHTALSRMEKLGLVERRHRDGNRRKLHVFLTPRGKGLEEELVPLAEDVNRVAVAGLTKTQVKELRESLFTIITNLALDEFDAVERGQRILSTREVARNARVGARKGRRASAGIDE